MSAYGYVTFAAPPRTRYEDEWRRRQRIDAAIRDEYERLVGHPSPEADDETARQFLYGLPLNAGGLMKLPPKSERPYLARQVAGMREVR